MSESERCETCRFWAKNKWNFPDKDEKDTSLNHYQCLVDPPRIDTAYALKEEEMEGDGNYRAVDLLTGVWPRTYDNDWCGSYQPCVRSLK